MNQDELREKLNSIIKRGLVAKAVVNKTSIPHDVLSRFKNGHVNLCEKYAEELESFLNKVVIP